MPCRDGYGLKSLSTMVRTHCAVVSNGTTYTARSVQYQATTSRSGSVNRRKLREKIFRGTRANGLVSIIVSSPLLENDVASTRRAICLCNLGEQRVYDPISLQGRPSSAHWRGPTSLWFYRSCTRWSMSRGLLSARYTIWTASN